MNIRKIALFASIATPTFFMAPAQCMAEENMEDAIAATEREPEPLTEEGRKWLSVHAMADIESAYICRGYIWDTRPYSAQEITGEADFGDLGRVSATAWSMSSKSAISAAR